MMNFVQQEDEEKAIERDQFYKLLPFSSSSSSSSSSSFALQQQNLWSDYKRQETSATTNLEFMDLSLANNNEEPPSSSGTGTGDTTSYRSFEKEHMFDKVVTPSDVGKLNRLVIPKQHAEKYFPLDSSSNEKGLLLNFEDRTGKAWRFRYSYWNSSQSYVMTKGWSRFVKEKKLDAGDIVSFQRGVGESGKDHLYIDWRRRPDAPDPTSLARLQLQNQLHFQQSIRWGRFFSSSLPQSIHPMRSYDPYQSLNYNHVYPYNHHHHHQQMLSFGNVPPTQQQYYLRSSSSTSSSSMFPSQQIGPMQERGVNDNNNINNTDINSNVPMVIDSVPIVHGKAAGKRLRLFGVNMDCPMPDDHHHHQHHLHHHRHHQQHLHLQSRLSNNEDNAPSLSTTAQADQYSKKGKSSLSFDLDP